MLRQSVPINLHIHIRKRMNHNGRKNELPDLKQGHIIKACNDLPLHLLNCLCTPCHLKSKFHTPPVLLNEIQLIVILGVEVTKVTASLDELLQEFLIQKVGLCKEKLLAAAISLTRKALEVYTSCKQALCRSRYLPYFQECLGALDGFHIPVHVPETICAAYRNWKGNILKNVLIACTFNMKIEDCVCAIQMGRQRL